jgi:hypothetical protein
VRAGEWTVRIGWDDEATATAVREVLAEFRPTHGAANLPIAFGVRSVAVGLLRRRLWLVHFGTPVRHRAPDLDQAARFVQQVLRGLAAGPPGDGEVATSLRAYVAGDRAVLVHVPDDVDLDERPLGKRGIRQLPTLSAIVRPASATVVHEDRSYDLCGVVIDARLLDGGATVDDGRRHVMSLAVGDRPPWAWVLDGLGDQVVVTADVARRLRDQLT